MIIDKIEKLEKEFRAVCDCGMPPRIPKKLYLTLEDFDLLKESLSVEKIAKYHGMEVVLGKRTRIT